MVTTLVSAPGSVVKNFQIVTEGGSYNDVACVFKQGSWLKGKLNGSDCTNTNYSDVSLVNIRKGVYSSDKENGTIIEYVFPKSLWGDFILNPPAGIDSTKYIQEYTSGVLSSTTSSGSQKIKGLVTYNSKGYVIDFSFSEV